MQVLTFDIEEWFHILDNESTKTEINWCNYESRIERNMDKIFWLLKKYDLKATFFVVGWIAKKYPKIIKKISKLGYEIGSHTNMHQLVYEQSFKEFDNDLKESIDILSNISGKKIKSFRAPGFSITERNSWAFDVLIKNGITHDCSVFPAGRAHGGFPSFKFAEPSIICRNGLELKEFPINTIKLLNYDLIFSGGGYFRLTPYDLIHRFTRKSNYIMTYFHPRDFDYEQPILSDLTLFRKFKSYVGLKNCMSKLERWVNDFNFIDLKTADKKINWDSVPKIII